MFESIKAACTILSHGYPDDQWHIMPYPVGNGLVTLCLSRLDGSINDTKASGFRIASDALDMLRTVDPNATVELTENRLWFTIAVEERHHGAAPRTANQLFASCVLAFGDSVCVSSAVITIDGDSIIFTFKRAANSRTCFKHVANNLETFFNYHRIHATVSVAELRRRLPHVLHDSTTLTVVAHMKPGTTDLVIDTREDTAQ